MKVQCICQYSPCQKSFLLDAVYVRRGGGKYCSYSCTHAARRHRIPCTCLTCGTVFLLCPSTKKKGGKYCSRLCQAEAQRNSFDAFWLHVNQCPHALSCPYCCWPFKGVKSDNYGTFTINYVAYGAHRIAWQLWNNQEIPHGLFCCHYCHYRPCCNPHHLHIGTQQVNLKDSSNDDRLPSGELHHGTSLTEDDIMQIFLFYAQGVSQTNLASDFHMTQANISMILLRRTWRHVPIPDHLLPH